MTADVLAAAIGIGLAVSLVFSEMFGLAAGGMVVPGYFALYLHKPGVVLATIGAALVTYGIVYMLGQIIIIYGKRRTVLMILVGYLVRMLINWGYYGALHGMAGSNGADLVVIGYIIPGLIAIWLDRQGVIETLSTLVAASVVVRLVMIIFMDVNLSLI